MKRKEGGGHRFLRPPIFLLSREKQGWGVFGRVSVPSKQPEVARRRGRRSAAAADEMTENSGTCLVARPSAVEESTSDSSLLYIIHENRKTAIISE